ncbi:MULTISPECIES: alkaline phosphatase family protein [unclassified Cellulophaga]|uniref:alkaline phosphatase family protein n=1 Tax=unclassified Cellulophaga TaxID=2634405 RepID=UPI0026E14B5A|nr:MULTISPECIES: alkaline phosphatase family protein [unclassified Cellulophaga]MDO6490025.1 alkaline phosphatase family protein [Cellulophaga sp. 2_MG-2023]MDO6494781.1 alkaline phosphatase family protein [Cellulophaga sp. 3_MG-2023]
MENKIKYVVFVMCLIVQVGFTQQTHKAIKNKKVVFVIVDGISTDMLQKAPTPFLDSIANIGSYTKAYVGGKKGGYSQTPTISAVGYNSLLTGTWVNKHNVYGNSIKKPNYNYPTIFKVFKDEYPSKKTAIFSTWLDNRTKLIEGESETKNVELDYAFDGFELDTINYPHDVYKQYIKKIDNDVAVEAARYIKTDAPDLSWVYLEYTDDVGHGLGDSPQLDDAITYEDALVGKIRNAIKIREAKFNEDWLLVVTTDHGRSPKDGRHHGGQTDRERATWIVTNKKNTNNYFKNETLAITDIYPTMLRFLNIDVSKDIAYEIDGTPFIGEVDAYGLSAVKEGDKIVVRWKSNSDKNVKGTIYTSATNQFKEGKKDTYTKEVTVSLTSEETTLSLKKHTGKMLKIVLETPNNVLNTWYINNN